MFVKLGNREFGFHRVDLCISETGIKNTFSGFDKKTIRELLENKRYQSLTKYIESNYEYLLDQPAGNALSYLKEIGDPLYLQFLNKYGDLDYTRFTVKGNEELLSQSGIYTIVVDDELVFAGVCASSFKLRFNQNIGNISPKCCFKDGTATHCHINAKITEHLSNSKVYFKICSMKNLEESKQVKNAIVSRFEPIWNIRLGKEASYT